MLHYRRPQHLAFLMLLLGTTLPKLLISILKALPRLGLKLR